jgi:hypothetical protein
VRETPLTSRSPSLPLVVPPAVAPPGNRPARDGRRQKPPKPSGAPKRRSRRARAPAEQAPTVGQCNDRRSRIARLQDINEARQRIERGLLTMAFLHLAGDVSILVRREALA